MSTSVSLSPSRGVRGGQLALHWGAAGTGFEKDTLLGPLLWLSDCVSCSRGSLFVSRWHHLASWCGFWCAHVSSHLWKAVRFTLSLVRGSGCCRGRKQKPLCFALGKRSVILNPFEDPFGPLGTELYE